METPDGLQEQQATSRHKVAPEPFVLTAFLLSLEITGKSFSDICVTEPSSCCWCPVRPNKLKHRSLEQRKVYCRAMQGEQVACAQNPWLLDGFGGEAVIGKIWGGAARCVAFFSLVGGEVTGRARNLAFSLKLLSSTWMGALVPAEELKDTVMYIPWGGTRTLPQDCTIVSWLLFPCSCIPSLPWLATVWICPLELREGQGGWRLFPANKKRGTQKWFVPRRATQGHLVSLELHSFCALSSQTLYEHFFFWTISEIELSLT